MKRYLKSITLLALIAALLMGCNTVPDTPDADTGTDKTENTETDLAVPAEDGFSVAYECPVIPYATDLSRITELNYNLHLITPTSTIFDYGLESLISSYPERSLAKRYYPINNGCWVRMDEFCRVETVDSVIDNGKVATRLGYAAQIIYPDGYMPHVPSTISGQENPLRGYFGFAVGLDTGDLWTRFLLRTAETSQNIVCINHMQQNPQPPNEPYFMFVSPIRENRFLRISDYPPALSQYYRTDIWDYPPVIPMYALFDRFTRLTEYKYCELYASGDVFLGLYFDEDNVLYSEVISETGEILRSEAADLREEYPEEKNDYGYDGLTVKRDSKTRRYYYVNAKGEAVCEPTFTECTNIKNGTAVVKIGSVLYMLVVTSAE